MKKLIGCFMIIIIVMACSCKAANNSITIANKFTEAQIKSLGYSVEVNGYNNEFVQTYKDRDGKTHVYLYSAPIENSENKIEKSDNYYKSVGNFNTKLFPTCLSSNAGIQIDGNSQISIYIPGGQEYKGILKQYENVFGQRRQAVTYKDMLRKGTEYRCYPTPFGVNTELVLSDVSAQPTFQVKFCLPNVTPDENSPDYILFRNSRNEVVAILYTPLLVDQEENWSYTNTIKIIDYDRDTATYTVEYSMDSAFIQESGRAFPVIANQSIHLYKAKQPDTSVYKNINKNESHYLSPYMLLGDQSAKGEGWTYIRFEVLDSLRINPDKIISASYTFRNLFDLKTDAKITAHAVTDDWCSINTRWFTRPPYDESPLSSVTVSKRDDYTLDITPLFKDWLKNKDRNEKHTIRNGFLIKSDTQNSNIVLSSGDNGLFSPCLEIVINDE